MFCLSRGADVWRERTLSALRHPRLQRDADQSTRAPVASARLRPDGQFGRRQRLHVRTAGHRQLRKAGTLKLKLLTVEFALCGHPLFLL